MPSMQDKLCCPHCGVELEVSTVISRLSLRWLGKPAPNEKRDGPIEGEIIDPKPRIEDKGK